MKTTQEIKEICKAAILTDRQVESSLIHLMKLLYITGARPTELIQNSTLSYNSSTNVLSFLQPKVQQVRFFQHNDFSIVGPNEMVLFIASCQRFSYSKFLATFYQYNLGQGSSLMRKKIGLHIFRHNKIKQLYFEDRLTVNQIRTEMAISSSSTVLSYINSIIN
jgi:hypothetical protein